MMDYKQVENKFRQLKAQFETGALTETEFRTKLEDLMIRDEQGNWWMIGYETELWYRYEDTNWVQRNFPGSPLGQRSIPIPNWVAILWVTLGWAIGGTIGGTSAWTMGGFIAGLVIAISLRTERILFNWDSIFWITLAWAVGGAGAWPISWGITEGINYSIGWAIGWLIGGLVTALSLRAEGALSGWISLFWITLGWVIGGAVGGAIGEAIDWTVGGAVGGAIGGFVMIKQLREGKDQK